MSEPNLFLTSSLILILTTMFCGNVRHFSGNLFLYDYVLWSKSGWNRQIHVICFIANKTIGFKTQSITCKWKEATHNTAVCLFIISNSNFLYITIFNNLFST